MARPPSSPDRDPEAVADFVERFGAAMVDAGMPQMPALVFVALLVADSARLSAEELATQLRVSPAAVSGAVKYLIHVGLVTRERQPGSRRHYYVLHDPTWYEVIARREQILDRWIAHTRAGVDAVGSGTPAGRRLAESLDFFEFLREEMSAMLARWRARQAGEASSG